MAAKETTRFRDRYDKVSSLYSAVKILTDVTTPCFIFNSMRPSKLSPLGSQMIKRELDVRVFEAEESLLKEYRAQLFVGRLALIPGLNLTRVLFSCVEKNFLR